MHPPHTSAVDLWVYVVTSCLIAATALYYFCISTYKKWEKLNVPYVRPVKPLFGNFLDVARGRDHMLEFYDKMYYALDGHKYGGIYQMRTPYLMVRDPETINNVLIKDFSHFTDRGIYSDFKVNPMSNHLFFMGNPQWKVIRSKLTPAFTSGKLKLMYEQIKECGNEMMKNINDILTKNNEQIEMKDVLGKYSTEVIGTCAFGLKLNAINDEEALFRKYGKKIFIPSLSFLFRELCVMITPALLKVVRVKDFPADAIDFFHAALKETITYREDNKIVRNDFVNVLMQARKDLVLNPDLPKEEKFTETQMVANAFAMFAAGFETTSTTITYCLYELALNKSIQDRVRQEIQLKLSKTDGEINNEFLMDLNYLDMVISETLRKYPPLVAVFRIATKTYQVPNDSLIIKKGQKLVIPVYSLHNNKKHFPDPEKFDPERFSAEEKAKRPNGTYLPFGDGPRICIGKRFAELEMKLALVEMLTEFEVFTNEKTIIPVKFAKKTLVLIPDHPVWLTLKKIA